MAPVHPDPARDLYTRLARGGEAAILDVLQHAAAEQDYLDFKIAGGRTGDGRTLTSGDRKNLGKAVSGFWNTAGGVIVWGIACNDNDEADQRTCSPGLRHADEIHAALLRELSRAVRPPVPGVEFTVVHLASGRGVVLMQVPWRGHSLPAEAAIADVRAYYLRAGESFVPIPPDILAGMMGAAPSSRIVPVVKPTNDTGRLALNLYIKNAGRGMAFHVYVMADWGPGWENGSPTFTSGNNEMKKYQTATPGFYTLGGPGLRVPPGAQLVVGNMQIPLLVRAPQEIRLRFTCGAEHDLPTYLDFRFPEDAVREAAELAKESTASATWTRLLQSNLA